MIKNLIVKIALNLKSDMKYYTTLAGTLITSIALRPVRENPLSSLDLLVELYT